MSTATWIGGLSSIAAALSCGAGSSGSSRPGAGGSWAAGGASGGDGKIATGGTAATGGNGTPGGGGAPGGTGNAGGGAATGGSETTTGGGAATGGSGPAGGSAAAGSSATGGGVATGGNVPTGGGVVTGGSAAVGGSPAAAGGTTGAGGSVAGGPTNQSYLHNYFADRGHSEAETQAKIDDAWQKLFGGDTANQSVYFPSGSNANGALASIRDIGNGDVRSEGMSYGMMIAVQTNHKAELDALWNWAMTYMYHADAAHPAHGYFAWQMSFDGTELDPMPAPDGEQYFAAALLFADSRWGSSTGIYDYKTRATTLLKDLVHHDQVTGNTSKGTKTGNAIFNPTELEVRFSPDVANQTSNGDFTDPSYHLPAFYEAFARVGPAADTSFWSTAAQKSRAFFLKAANPTTGLTPDYANFDGSPKAASWDAKTATFRYDAFRTVVNWSVDYAWNKKSKDEAALSNRLLTWFGASRATSSGSLYLLDGTSQGPDNALGLLACNAVGALAADAAIAAPFVDALWSAGPPTGTWRYYDGMLYFLAVLHVSGQFRDWTAK